MAKLPQELQAIRAAVSEHAKAVEALKAKLDATKKEIRLKEKDLEFSNAKRVKAEARLYEVKTNKEYSAVLAEIEEIKQEKARIEEETLALMERQERLSVEVREAEARLRARDTQAKAEDAEVRERLANVEADLAIVQSDRDALARQLPADLLASYEKLLRHRSNLGVSRVLPGGICGGCRVTLTPQTFQELKQQSGLRTCESCGRYLYWEPA
jgi:hypothetical protein